MDANKGVCSFLEITDELRPIIARTGQPIDFISGPITGVGRMNFGQFVEGCISKAIDNSEQIIIKDESKIGEELRKLSKISDVLSDHEYAQKIRNLADDIDVNPNVRRQFMNSVHENGLYMEAPGFANCELQDLEKVIYDETGIRVQEDIVIKKELIQYVNEVLSSVSKKNLKLPTPNHDVTLPDIYCAPIYTLKLKQEAYYRSTSRDFGSYKSTNSQPVQGRSADGFIGASARLGQMEFDGLLAHSALKVMNELRTVKNDSKELKRDLTHQIIATGSYNLPETRAIANFTKTLIEGHMMFLND